MPPPVSSSNTSNMSSTSTTPSQRLKNTGRSLLFPQGRHRRTTVTLFSFLLILWAVCCIIISVSWHATPIQIQMLPPQAQAQAKDEHGNDGSMFTMLARTNEGPEVEDVIQSDSNCVDYTTNKKPFYPQAGSGGCNTELMMGGRRPYCRFANLMVDQDKIQSTMKGGEALDQVRGQGEDDEMLTYQRGAFTSFVPSLEQIVIPPPDRSMFYYVNDVLEAFTIVDENAANTTALTGNDHCSNTIPGVTLFLQRYEYVNLYHTMTDWFNTWLAYREFGSDNVAGVVFLDAHPAGSLDDAWTTLFGNNVQRAQRLTATKSCFESAVLVPAGYASQIYAAANATRCADPDLMTQFVDFVLDRFDLQETRTIPGRVVLIDRRPYTAHARSSTNTNSSTTTSTSTTDDRIIENMYAVARSINGLVPEVTSVQVLQLHTMTLRAQIQAVREAHVLIGNHGAGLTQLLFLDKDTYVLEFSRFNKHFVELCQWKERVTHYMLPGVKFGIDAEYALFVLLPILGSILQGRNILL